MYRHLNANSACFDQKMKYPVLPGDNTFLFYLISKKIYYWNSKNKTHTYMGLQKLIWASFQLNSRSLFAIGRSSRGDFFLVASPKIS